MVKCIECGTCRTKCPVFRATLLEKLSPRGKVILEKNEILAKEFYICALCNQCKKVCIINADLPFKEMRQKLVRKGIETEPNKKIIQNLEKFGVPFGLKNGNPA